MNPITRMIIGAAIGAVVGFAIYRFIGCRTGVCPLNSNPYISVLIWSVLGALVAGGK